MSVKSLKIFKNSQIGNWFDLIIEILGFYRSSKINIKVPTKTLQIIQNFNLILIHKLESEKRLQNNRNVTKKRDMETDKFLR